MRRDPTLALFLATLLGSSTASAQAPPQAVEVIEARPYRSPDEKRPDLRAVANLLVERANSFRLTENLPRVVLDDKLAATARYFAACMAQADRFGHTADGYDPGIRVKAHGYEFGLLSENIACCFHTDGFTTEALARKLDEGWKDSPGHRANMLDPDVTEAGMAVARSETTGYYYAIQLFARPSSRSVIVEIANRTESPLSYRFADQPFSLPPDDGRIHEQGRPTDLVFEFRVDGKPATRKARILEGKSRITVAESDGVVRFTRD